MNSKCPNPQCTLTLEEHDDTTACLSAWTARDVFGLSIAIVTETDEQDECYWYCEGTGEAGWFIGYSQVEENWHPHTDIGPAFEIGPRMEALGLEEEFAIRLGERIEMDALLSSREHVSMAIYRYLIAHAAPHLRCIAAIQAVTAKGESNGDD